MSERTQATLLTFGEVMLRLSPPDRQLLLQSPRLDVWVAGAEANVAVQLAHLCHPVRFVSRVPDNALGHAAIAKLRGYAVDVTGIALGGDRIGLYFVTPGAGRRATDVIYDRAGSAFADAEPDTWDWNVLLDGVSRVHLSGITPALGLGAATNAIACARAAAARGIAISFDGNWRSKLWARWPGDARALLGAIVEHADILFGDHRDISVLLGRTDLPAGRAAADAAFAAFPKLTMIAATSRTLLAADRHRLGASLHTREESVEAAETELGGMVDRIGSGDAFVAGVLDAISRNVPRQEAIEHGLALAVLKHSIPGDSALFSRADVQAFLVGDGDVRR